ncbi:MAG: DUF4407 domain-containing protein [Bacteroidota bacterium]
MFYRFFVFCSGADQNILATCSHGERTKYAGIGATVFFTALMAVIASSYALYTIFDNWYVAIGFGIVWGALIFNLDRYIVSTLKKRDTLKRELWQATPRLLLAIIIATVISKPLELKIFEKEIDQLLLEEKNTRTLANQQQIALQYNPKITALQNEITDLKSAIAAKEQETNALYDTYIAEAEGTAGTRLRGKGPVYQEKRDKHDALLAELQVLKQENAQKITANEAQISRLENAYDTAVRDAQPTIDRFDGLMARITALGRLPWLPSFFIFLLFLAIETAPILVKLLASKGEYDHKLEEADSILAQWTAQKMQQRQLIRDTDVALNEEIYHELQSEQELYQYKKQKAAALLRKQADAFYQTQAKNL